MPTKAPGAAELAHLEAVRRWRLGEGLDQVSAAAAKFLSEQLNSLAPAARVAAAPGAAAASPATPGAQAS